MLEVRGINFENTEQSLKQLASDWAAAANSDAGREACIDLFTKTALVAKLMRKGRISREERDERNKLKEVLLNEFKEQISGSNKFAEWVAKTQKRIALLLS